MRTFVAEKVGVSERLTTRDMVACVWNRFAMAWNVSRPKGRMRRLGSRPSFSIPFVEPKHMHRRMDGLKSQPSRVEAEISSESLTSASVSSDPSLDSLSAWLWMPASTCFVLLAKLSFRE